MFCRKNIKAEELLRRADKQDTGLYIVGGGEYAGEAVGDPACAVSVDCESNVSIAEVPDAAQLTATKDKHSPQSSDH